MDFKTYIRLFSGKVISESKLDKDTKIQLLNYVKEADIYEVMALLMDGEVQTISEQSKPIVLERFKKSEVPEKIVYFANEGVAKSVMGIMISPPLWIAWRAAKGLLNKCSRKCGTFKISNQRKACLIKCKIKSYQEQIKVLQKVKKEAKDKDKAKKVDEKIKDLSEKIKKQEEKLKNQQKKGSSEPKESYIPEQEESSKKIDKKSVKKAAMDAAKDIFDEPDEKKVDDMVDKAIKMGKDNEDAVQIAINMMRGKE